MSILEIGPGRGDFLFQLAAENPGKTISAIEFKRKRFEKLARRIESKGVPNIHLYLGDARWVLPREFPDESLERIFILFPDPWPKRRHAKHRLFQESFVREIHRVLKPQGEVFISHDDRNYVSQIREVFDRLRPLFQPFEKGVDFQTFYADKWLKEGRAIDAFSYVKNA